MADFPLQSLPFAGVISTALALGPSLITPGVSPASAAWPSASLAIFVPVQIPLPCTVYKLVMGAGVTAAGNFDIGIYDAAGNKMVSSGATAKGTSVKQVLDVTDTVIGPGLYYLALAADGTNNYIRHTISVQACRLAGVVEAAASYTLPSSVTFSASTGTFIPSLAAYLRPY